MRTAFACQSEPACVRLESLDDIERAMRNPNTRVWVDLEAPDPEEVFAVGQLFGLADSALEDCLHGEQRPRIDEFETYIFLVLYGMLGAEEDDAYAPRKLAIFVGQDFLITVHRQPVRITNTIRDRYEAHGLPLLNRGVDNLLFHIIDGLVDNLLRVTDSYEDRVETAEDLALEPEPDDGLPLLLSDLRRDLLELRHVAAAQRTLIEPVAAGAYDYINEQLASRFAHVRDHLIQVVESVDRHRELLNSIRDLHEAATSHRLNRVVNMLTIYATVLLPASLVASIYGMNVKLWPGMESRGGFAIVLLIMSVCVIGSVAIFRRLKWL
jgi:magnesium transporter